MEERVEQQARLGIGTQRVVRNLIGGFFSGRCN
jgi:hypothetical protein